LGISRGLARAPAALRAGVWIGLAINLLDLTTSWLPAPLDVEYPIPERGGAATLVQVALVVPWALWTAYRLPTAVRTLWGLPIPRLPLVVCGLFALVELGFVALRQEAFPFSCVAMYSHGVREARGDHVQRLLLVARDPEGLDLVSPVREGDPVFRRYGLDLDYKASTIFDRYLVLPNVHGFLQAELRDQGVPESKVMRVRFRVADGRVVGLDPHD
jgi:hypothetical protein